MISERSINANDIPNDRKKVPDRNVYSYECISTATNNFSLERKLGEGGFGPVYMVISSNFFFEREIIKLTCV